jgi:hypothetical protein
LDDLPRKRLLLLFPDFMARLTHFGPLTPQASGFLRLIGMLVSGFGMLCLVSGRLNAEGFVFTTLIDRPFAAPTMSALWYFGALPAPHSYLQPKIPQAAFGLWLRGALSGDGEHYYHGGKPLRRCHLERNEVKSKDPVATVKSCHWIPRLRSE